MRIERFPNVDVSILPPNPAPPDFWQERAACFGVDPDIFFPISEEEAGPALTFCNSCRIKEECLAWALKNGERYGVWAGSPSSSAGGCSAGSPETTPPSRVPLD